MGGPHGTDRRANGAGWRTFVVRGAMDAPRVALERTAARALQRRPVSSPCRLAASLLRGSSRAYAAAALTRLRQGPAELATAGLPSSFGDPLADTEVRLLHLAESVMVDRPALLRHALRWYRVAFHHRGVAADYLPRSLDALSEALRDELPADAAAVVLPHLAAAREGLELAPLDVPSHLSRSAPYGDTAARFLLAVLEGRGDAALDLVRTMLAAGASVADVHDHVIVPAQRESGRMWLMAEIPIADEHYGSAVVERVLWMLDERLPRPAADARRVLTLAAGGNLHELGLRIVAQRLRLAGLAVHDLGGNMPAADLEWLLQDRAFDLVAVSATLVLHISSAASTIDVIRRAGSPNGTARPRILVGGEPFTIVPDLHERIGADAAAVDAERAVAAAKRLLGPPA